MDIDVKNLHPLEVRLLRAVKMGEDITAERIIKELDYKVGQCNQAFSWLSAKGLIVEKNRVKYAFYELTDTGKSQAELGLPVERIFTFLKENGAHTLPEIAASLSLEQSDVGSSFGQLSGAKCAALNGERKAELISDSLPNDVVIARALINKALNAPLMEADLTKEEKNAIKGLAKKR